MLRYCVIKIIQEKLITENHNYASQHTILLSERITRISKKTKSSMLSLVKCKSCVHRSTNFVILKFCHQKDGNVNRSDVVFKRSKGKKTITHRRLRHQIHQINNTSDTVRVFIRC